MLKLIIFFLLFPIKTDSKTFCKVDNILNEKNQVLQCKEDQLLFGYLNFKSKDSNFEYIIEETLNLKIISKFKLPIIKFIKNYCDYSKNTLKIKEITNLNTYGPGKYITKVVISCSFKNE